MAREASGDVVYDSQDEKDEWPESQESSASDPKLINELPRTKESVKPQVVLKVYRHKKKPIPGSLNTTSPPQSQASTQRSTNSSRSRTVSHEPQTLAKQPVPSQPLSIRSSVSPETDRFRDIFDFESSDDDVPLQPIPPKPTLQPKDSTPLSPASDILSGQRVPSSPITTLPPSEAPRTSHTPTPSRSQSPPRRALRARKPEQQMPYTLDLIRHRDQFRRRGLKPVHNPELQYHSHGTEEDDQYQADEELEPELDKDERYVPPKDVSKDGQERAAKRQKVQAEDEQEDVGIRLEVGNRWIDPRKFDVSPWRNVSEKERRNVNVETVQELDTEKEMPDHDFNSEDGTGFSHPASPQTERQHSVSEQPGRASPKPDTTLPSAAGRRLKESAFIDPDSIFLDDEEPAPQPSRYSISSDASSNASSSSSEDEIERLKKRARGVLPGSFFTVQTQKKPSQVAARYASDRMDPDRKGVAKKKKNKSRQSFNSAPFTYPVSSSEEDEPEPPEKEKRNFVDLTREEQIEDNVDGWNIQEDLIDRMLNWGAGARATGAGNSKSKKSELRHRKEKKSHSSSKKVHFPVKRKRQTRINEFTASTTATTQSRNVTKSNDKRRVRLSIVDACDVYSVRNARSPPPFMKIARRQSMGVRNFGRRKPPNSKMFQFAEENDQEDVQTVITDWQNGNIVQDVKQRTWAEPVRLSKPPSTNVRRDNPVSGPRKMNIRRIPLAPLQEENSGVGNHDYPSLIPKINQHASKTQQNTTQSIKLFPGINRSGNRRRAPKPVSRRPDDIANWLRNTATDIPDVNDTESFPESFQYTQPLQRAHPRPRKSRVPNRRDVNKFDKRFQLHQGQGIATTTRQLSLDDIWFPNDSSSLTFGVIAVPGGIHLDLTTFMGRGLLTFSKKTKPADDEEIMLWAPQEIRIALDVESACNRLASDLDQILDLLDELRLCKDGEVGVSRLQGRILDFASFVVRYLSQLTSSDVNDIQTFGSKQVRLTEIAMDRLDGTTLASSIDLAQPLTLVSLSLLQTLLVSCGQLCVLTSHNLSMLGADQLMSKLSRRLLQYLLNGGFDPLQQAIRKTRATGPQVGCNSILIDIWSTLYNLLVDPHIKLRSIIPSFWTLLQSELEIDGTMDGKILDRAWYTIMNVSAITVFTNDGKSKNPSCREKSSSEFTIWNIVEGIVNPYLQSYATFQHHRYDRYIRTLFGRCHTLVSSWGWSQGAKAVITTFYNFFTDRRFDNLKTEAFSGLPKFFHQQDTSLEIQTSDTTFTVFLKLIVAYVTHQQSDINQLTERRDKLAAMKDLDRFVNRITPLRTYQSTFAPLDYIALQNHYCLLLALYWVGPVRSRPSVERIRDVIDIEMAPAPAQVICMETWSLLVQLQLRKKEDLTSTMDWFRVIFRHSMKEFQVAMRLVATEDQDQIKSKLRSMESIVLKSLQVLGDHVVEAAETLGPLVDDVTEMLVKSSHELPAVLLTALFSVLKSFFGAIDRITTGIQLAVPDLIEQDSQDYGDAAFFEEFIAQQDSAAPFPIGATISNVTGHLFRLLANHFASLKRTPENLQEIIDVWIQGISILVRHHQQDWTTFLQYGGEWERLRSANTANSRTWSPYILTKVLSADRNSYFQGRDHFIGAWFESIIEPDLQRQHTFTALLLNVDDEKSVLVNSLFAKNREGVYEISGDALFEARPALIVHALSNLGKNFESLLSQGDHAAISTCKQRYLDYLHRMLSNMKSIYLDLKHTESEDLIQYISLAQHVTGNIIQYCSSFLKESARTFADLPILDYFTNPETFPQPGLHELVYAAQRLCGTARKDSHRPFTQATQSDVFWSIKSFLEKNVRNGEEGEDEFMEFCVLAMGEREEGVLGDHVLELRRFVVCDVFCEWFRMAAERSDGRDLVWGYVVPCLNAVRAVYASVWEKLLSNDVDAIQRFVDDLLVLMTTLFVVVEVIEPRGRYSILYARAVDFVIFVDHVVFYIKEIATLQGIQDLQRLVQMFRQIALQSPSPTITVEAVDRNWVKEWIASHTRVNQYMRATVRREIRDMQYNVPILSREKLEKIEKLLIGDEPKVGVDDVIATYV